MQTIEEIAWDDTVLPFQLDRANIRGRAARVDRTLLQALEQHDYPAEVSALVAEAVLLTALIGQTIKLRWKLSLQIRGNGPIRIIATDYFGPKRDGDPARLRAYASYDADRLAQTDGSGFEKIGKGMFAVLIDQGEGMAPYQGITPLSGGSLAHCAETYFAQSEQLPTRFALSMALATLPGEKPVWRAGGLMLQHMPQASGQIAGQEASGAEKLQRSGASQSTAEEENWRRATMLLDTVEEVELIGPHVSPPELLTRLFHQEEPRIFDPQPIEFGCTCSAEKVRQSMSIYSAKDIQTMTTKEGFVTADCQFCGGHYALDPKTLGFEADTGDGNRGDIRDHS